MKREADNLEIWWVGKGDKGVKLGKRGRIAILPMQFVGTNWDENRGK